MVKMLMVWAMLSGANPIFSQNPDSANFQWPSGYEPSQSKFFVHNEIEINAQPDVVWRILTDALEWEAWYEGAENVSFKDSSQKKLEANTLFYWQTMGLSFESAIQQFEQERVLAWESKKKSIQGYHVWLILPTENGCKVITEESQKGWLTFLEKTFQRKKLKRLHDIWLTELKKKSEQIHHPM